MRFCSLNGCWSGLGSTVRTFKAGESLTQGEETRVMETVTRDLARIQARNRALCTAYGWSGYVWPHVTYPFLNYSMQANISSNALDCGSQELAMAVARYQVANGLSVDGILGPKTLNALKVDAGLAAPDKATTGGGTKPNVTPAPPVQPPLVASVFPSGTALWIGLGGLLIVSGLWLAAKER